MDELNQPITPPQASQAPDQMDSSFEESHNSKIIPIIIGIVLLILVGAGSYILGTKKSQPTAENIVQTTPSLSPIPTIDATANWKAYQDSFGNYSIQYPQSWTSKNTFKTEITQVQDFFSPDYIEGQSNEPGMSITTISKGISLSIRTEENSVFQSYEDYKNFIKNVSTGHFQKGNSEEIKVDNEQCLYSENIEDLGGFVSACSLLHNGKTYDFVFKSKVKYSTLFKEILSTFKFTNQSSLTSDQIFSEAASQLGITRSQLSYFIIFGQDKIQYSFGSGTNFAYKYADKWQTAGGKDAQGIGNCTELNNVPEQYRPVCYDTTTGKEKYMDSQRQSLNYSPSQMTSYIGE